MSIPSARAKRYCTALGECNMSPEWDILGPRRRGFRTPASSMIEHMSEIFRIPVRMNSLFEQQQRQLSNAYYHTPPRYDIGENDKSMELSFDLPGVHASDISLTLTDRNTVLKITASRKHKQHGQIVSTEFDQMFTIDPTVLDVDKIEASLSDGVLVVSVPKLTPSQEVMGEKKIPITIQNKDTENIQRVSIKEGSEEIERQDHDEKERSGEVVDDLEITEEELI
jgi:Molecular chaperone (small heat shock protein)